MDLPTGITLGYDHTVIYPQGRGTVFQPPQLDEMSFEELRSRLPRYQRPQQDNHNDSLEITCVQHPVQKRVQETDETTDTEVPMDVGRPAVGDGPPVQLHRYVVGNNHT